MFDRAGTRVDALVWLLLVAGAGEGVTAPAVDKSGGDRRFVAVADGEPTPRSDVPALRAWATDHGVTLIPVDGVLVAAGPRRLEGGLTLEHASLVQALPLFFTRLAPEDVAALVNGRSLLLDRPPAEARDVLRSIAPGLFGGPSAFPGTLELGRPDRREQWAAAWQATHNQPMTDEDWQAIAAREARDLALYQRFHELVYRPALAVSVDLFAQVLDSEGKPASDRMRPFSSNAVPAAGTYTDWEDDRWSPSAELKTTIGLSWIGWPDRTPSRRRRSY